MMTPCERSEVIHIMMNRFTLTDSDTAQLEFSGRAQGNSHRITILVVEDLTRISIERNGGVVYSDTVKSIDDLKIFFEERLYKYFEA